MTAANPVVLRRRLPGRPRRAVLIVAGILAVPYLYELLGAVSNLVAVLGLANAIGGGLTTFTWIVLAGGLAIPIVAYVLALLVARARRPGSVAMILIVAFCASEALTLSLLALYQSAVGVA